MPASYAATNHFSTGHFKLVIDGKPVTSFIKSVEGGLINAQSVEEPVGQYNIRGRHLGTREVEPIQIEFGMSGSKWALDLVDDFIGQRKHHRLNGEIRHADANMVTQFMYTFSSAVITEVTLPKLDAAGKDSLMCKVKLQPQDVTFQLGDATKLHPDPIGRQKAWTSCNFRVSFDNGADATYVSSVEAMTIKLGHKVMQLSDMFRPDVLPTKVDMPKLSINVPLMRAGDFVKWYQKSVANQLENGTPDADQLGTGKNAGGYETSASIEYMDATLSQVLYTVELFGVGMEKFSIMKSEANAGSVKMAKFDFYVTDIKVRANGGGF
ncbi:MAG TPA: phage tail protein [Kofleriaceae bacterium]|nr:phage tail protein [Kofleriaceae bacterium]